MNNKSFLFMLALIVVAKGNEDDFIDDDEAKMAMNPDLPRREFKRDGFTFVVQNIDPDMASRTQPDKPFQDTMHLNYKENEEELELSLESDLEWLQSDLTNMTRDDDDLFIVVIDKPSNCNNVVEINDTIQMDFIVRFKNASGHIYRRSEEPVQIELNGQLPLGWEEGLLGACESEERHLTLKPSKAFGHHGTVVGGHAFPGHVDFFVEVKVIKLMKAAENEHVGQWSPEGDLDLFESIDSNNDDNIERSEMYAFVVSRVGGEGSKLEWKKRARLAQFVRQMFRADDWDFDGVISLDEFAEHRESVVNFGHMGLKIEL